MDTDFVTLENQPSVDSESETLEIEQTQPQGLMGRPSGEIQVDRTEPPSMADEEEGVSSGGTRWKASLTRFHIMNSLDLYRGRSNRIMIFSCRTEWTRYPY
mgnify:CR=1 FL=1